MTIQKISYNTQNNTTNYKKNKNTSNIAFGTYGRRFQIPHMDPALYTGKQADAKAIQACELICRIVQEMKHLRYIVENRSARAEQLMKRLDIITKLEEPAGKIVRENAAKKEAEEAAKAAESDARKEAARGGGGGDYFPDLPSGGVGWDNYL